MTQSNGFFATTQSSFQPKPVELIAEAPDDQLKEKLFVAEKVMRTLFERNKELESN